MRGRNPYQPVKAKVLEVIEETPTIKTLRLKPEVDFSFKAGQFVSMTVYGVGEAPFTPSSSPFEKDYIELTVMKVGRVTEAIHALKPGDEVGIRGPFGRPYPLEKFEGREVFIVGGGVGLAPLRALLLALLHHKERYKGIYLRYGARMPKGIVFKKEIEEWKKLIDVEVTVDVADETWKGKVGVVTVLLDEIPVDVKTAVAAVCGPPIMMHYVNLKLLEKGFREENIYLSMEKSMSCGIGKCGHCQMDNYLICRDGPVFTWAQIKHIREPFL